MLLNIFESFRNYGEITRETKVLGGTRLPNLTSLTPEDQLSQPTLSLVVLSERENWVNQGLTQHGNSYVLTADDDTLPVVHMLIMSEMGEKK